MKNKKIIIIVSIIVLTAILLITGISAYLTSSTEIVENTFTIGKVEIKLEEPSWDGAEDTDNDGIPNFAENIVPNQTISKDPQIKNTGENEAYVYIKVTVPVEEVIVADENGTITNNEKIETDLFKYTINNGWKEIVSEREDILEENKVKAHTYVYCYENELIKGATTPALFNKVTFINVVDGQIAAPGSYKIDVQAYAIQSKNLKEGTTAEGAYQIYLNQESDLSIQQEP